MKQTQKSGKQKPKPANGKRSQIIAAPPPRPKPSAMVIPAGVVRKAVAEEVKRATSMSHPRKTASRDARSKVHHSLSRVANHHVGPVDISAEERAIVTAFSTMHPELMRGKVADSITSATSELRTVTNYGVTTVNNGAGQFEAMFKVHAFMNDQVYSSTTWAAGVCATAGSADNPYYGPWTSTVGEMRLVSMSVVVTCTTPALNLTGNWVIGNSRSSMTPLVGASYLTYAQVVDFAKGQFTVDNPDCRMIWMANDESDRNFFALTDSPITIGNNGTNIICCLTSGAAVGSFNVRICCNWEAIPVPAAQSLVATTATPTDPGTFTQAMAAAADSAIKHVAAVTDPVEADRSSGGTLAEIATSALGVAGDILTGDMPGLAKDAISALSPVKDAIEGAVGFVSDGISSIFGLSVSADAMLRDVIRIGVLSEDVKCLDEIKDLDTKFGLNGALCGPVIALANLSLTIASDKTPRRIRDVIGIQVCLKGKQTLCRLPEGESGRVRTMVRSSVIRL